MNRRTYALVSPINQSVQQGYNLDGTVAWVYDGKNTQLTGYLYDLLGRPTYVVYPDNSSGHWDCEHWAYDDVGQVLSYVNRASNTQTYSQPDSRGRYQRYDWNDGVTSPQAMFYNAKGWITVLGNNFGNLSYTYNDAGEVLTETQNVGYQNARTVGYHYNDDGLVDILTYPNGAQMVYTYNARHPLVAAQRDVEQADRGRADALRQLHLQPRRHPAVAGARQWHRRQLRRL